MQLNGDLMADFIASIMLNIFGKPIKSAIKSPFICIQKNQDLEFDESFKELDKANERHNKIHFNRKCLTFMNLNNLSNSWINSFIEKND
jgi:hypothetical protein